MGKRKSGKEGVENKLRVSLGREGDGWGGKEERGETRGVVRAGLAPAPWAHVETFLMLSPRARVLINRRIDKEAMRKKEMLPFAAWTQLEGIILSEINQTEEGEFYTISLICGI